MRPASFLPALAAVVAATPRPQDIDFSMVMAVPNSTYTESVGVTAQVVTYDPATILEQATATISSVEAAETVVADSDAVKRDVIEKRTACALQPTGISSTTPTADNPSAFVSNTVFASIASAAATPAGYTNTFTNLQGSNNAMGYLGFTTLQTYDSQACASKCDKINGCMAVNICTNPAQFVLALSWLTLDRL